MNMVFLEYLRSFIVTVYYLPFEFGTTAAHGKLTLLWLTSWAPPPELPDRNAIKWEYNCGSSCWLRVPGSALNAPPMLSHSALGSYWGCHNASKAEWTQQKKQACIILKNKEIFPELYIICKTTYYIICILQNNSQKAVWVLSSSSMKKTITEWFKEKSCDTNCNQSLIKISI